jgi:hypothetical protein
VIVGSYVPEGVAVAEWVISVAQGITGFYDIDTPITLAKLRRGDTEYLAPDLIPRFQLYLSFTGGPMCRSIELEFGAPMARPLYCSVDPAMYYPEVIRTRHGTWDSWAPTAPIVSPPSNVSCWNPQPGLAPGSLCVSMTCHPRRFDCRVAST